jgi:glycosyltransferase involved in cell wall biosynthesis
MSTDYLDAVVLHVALDPITGVWSVMRDLALAQAASGCYAAVGIGVVSSSAWPDRYANELATAEIRSYHSSTLKLFGTAQFLWQCLQLPPIEKWVEDLMKKSDSSQAIVHFHNAWMSGVFLPLRATGYGNIRVLATMHGMFANFDRKPFRHWLHRWRASRLIRYHARLTSVDKAGTVQAEKLFGMRRELFTVIHNGVANEPSLRASEWSGEGVFRLGYLGNLEERKGWEIGARAILELNAIGMRVRYIIAGSGPQSEQAQAWQRSHPDLIEYVGYVSQPRKTLLTKLHALTLMSSDEGLPMSLVEALSIGLPVIATRAGGIIEIITDGISGLLVSRDSRSLEDAIVRLYKQPSEHLRLGNEGRRIFLESLELKRVLRDYHNLYLQSLQESEPSSSRYHAALFKKTPLSQNEFKKSG